MAKGFTVKAKTPTSKKDEWDIAAIKERMRGKTIAVSYTHLTLPTNREV